MRWLSIIIFFIALNNSAFSKEKELKVNLKVKSPHVYYELEKQGNYLRFRLHSQEIGFYLKSCHAKVVDSIEDTLRTSILQLGRYPAAINDDYAQVTFEGTKYSLGLNQFRVSSFPNLPTKLQRLMKLGSKMCK